LYAKSAGTVKMTLKAGKDIILSQQTASVLRGINYADFNVNYDDKMLTQYQKWLNDNQKDKEAKPIELKAAANGKYYLQKGKYTVEIEKDGVKQEEEFVIE
jgi:hypothetical protein